MEGLRNILAGSTNQTNSKEEILVQKLGGHPLDVVREGCREEEGGPVLLSRH